MTHICVAEGQPATMVYRKIENQMKIMLADTILALCRNALPFKGQVSVEGLLGITIDYEEIFLVNINETIQKEGFVKSADEKSTSAEKRQMSSSEESADDDTQGPKKKRKRRKRRSKDLSDNEQSEEWLENYPNSEQSVGVKPEADNETGSESENDDLVFVKEEPLETPYEHNFSHHSSGLEMSYSSQSETVYPVADGSSQPTDFPHIFAGANQSGDMMQLQELSFQVQPAPSGVS